MLLDAPQAKGGAGLKRGSSAVEPSCGDMLQGRTCLFLNILVDFSHTLMITSLVNSNQREREKKFISLISQNSHEREFEGYGGIHIF